VSESSGRTGRRARGAHGAGLWLDVPGTRACRASRHWYGVARPRVTEDAAECLAGISRSWQRGLRALRPRPDDGVHALAVEHPAHSRALMPTCRSPRWSCWPASVSVKWTCRPAVVHHGRRRSGGTLAAGGITGRGANDRRSARARVCGILYPAGADERAFSSLGVKSPLDVLLYRGFRRRSTPEARAASTHAGRGRPRKGARHLDESCTSGGALGARRARSSRNRRSIIGR